LVEALRAGGWDVELKTFVLGVSGVVYAHNEEVLKWIGMDGKTELKDAVRELALMGAQWASKVCGCHDKLDMEEKARAG